MQLGELETKLLINSRTFAARSLFLENPDVDRSVYESYIASRGILVGSVKRKARLSNNSRQFDLLD